MRAQPKGRTDDCSRGDALQLLAEHERSRSLMEAARLVVGDDEFRGVAAALTVLAGIAASDAACCAVLACRHRGQDHRGAIDLLAGVEPGGGQRIISPPDDMQSDKMMPISSRAEQHARVVDNRGGFRTGENGGVAPFFALPVQDSA